MRFKNTVETDSSTGKKKKKKEEGKGTVSHHREIIKCLQF